MGKHKSVKRGVDNIEGGEMDRSPEKRGDASTQQQLEDYSKRAKQVENERDKYRQAWKEQYESPGASDEGATIGQQAEFGTAVRQAKGTEPISTESGHSPDERAIDRDITPRGSSAKKLVAEQHGERIDEELPGDPSEYGGAIEIGGENANQVGGQHVDQPSQVADYYGATTQGEPVVTSAEEERRRNSPHRVSERQGVYFGGERHWGGEEPMAAAEETSLGTEKTGELKIKRREGDIEIEDIESLTHEASENLIGYYEEFETAQNKHAVMADVGVTDEWIEDVRSGVDKDALKSKLRDGASVRPSRVEGLSQDEVHDFFESLDESGAKQLDSEMAELLLAKADRDSLTMNVEIAGADIEGVDSEPTTLKDGGDLMEFAGLNEREVESMESILDDGELITENHERYTDRGVFSGVHQWADGNRFVPGRGDWEELSTDPYSDVDDIYGIGDSVARRLEDKFGTREIAAFADTSPSKVADSVKGLGERKADSLITIAQEANHARTQVDSLSSELAEKYEMGEFGKGEYEAILKANAQYRRDPNAVASYLDDNSGMIPGVKRSIGDLRPGSDYETVQGRVMDVKPVTVSRSKGGETTYKRSPYYNSGQALVFDIQDETGTTQVTVWQDSVNIPDNIGHRFDETTGRRITWDMTHKADLTQEPAVPSDEIIDTTPDELQPDSYGLDVDPVTEGDYVRLENVSVNESGHPNHEHPSLSTTPSSSMELIVDTKTDRNERLAAEQNVVRPYPDGNPEMSDVGGDLTWEDNESELRSRLGVTSKTGADVESGESDVKDDVL